MKKIWATILEHKKWVIGGVLLLVAGTAGWMYQNANKTTAVAPVQVVKAERGDVVSTIAATGSIQPVNMVDISAKITAQIKEVKVKENDQVKAGQVLVVLKDDDIRPQLIQAEERVTNAAANYERNKKLNAVGAIAEQQLDSMRMEYNIARANYDQILSKLNETVITAPIDGTVIGKPLPAGQTVAQGVNNPIVILTVADMSKMQIEALVDQTDIGKVAVGQKVTFTVDAYPDKKFTGVVANVSQKATTQQNVIFYTVTVDVKNGESLLKPSMVARVSINVGESKDTVTLPLAAIRTDKEGKFVVVSEANGQSKNVRVTTGVMGEDRIEIKSGVNAGDSVVIPQLKTQGQNANGQRTGGQPSGNPVNSMMRRM